MSIRLKLVLLILLVLLGGCVGIGLFLGMTAPSRLIESEMQQLDQVHAAFLRLHAETSRYATQFIEPQQTVVRTAYQATKDSFAAVASFKQLPKISERVEASLGLITQLETTIDGKMAEVDRSLGLILQDARSIFTSSARFRLNDVYTSYAAAEYPDIQAVRNRVEQLHLTLSTLDMNISSFLNLARTQTDLIRDEVARIERRATLTAIAFALVLITLSVVFALIIATRIAVSIKALGADLEKMKDGDLAIRFIARGRDDIARLSSYLNTFAVALCDAFARIQSISRQNVAIKEDLISTVSESGASIHQIRTNTQSIEGSIGTLARHIEEAGDSVKDVIGGTSKNHLFVTLINIL